VEKVRQLAGRLIKSADRGASITRRLLAFSRRGELRVEAVDPVSLLADMGEILAHTLGDGIRLQLDAPVRLPPLLADRSQLETVLINLATNARDAMRSGGTLTLAAAVETVGDDGTVHAGDLKAGSYIRLSMTDTGVGIVPDILARVTEPFFTTKAKGKGTGLGLAMAHGFAAQSGGGLHIESTHGGGTTVKLWFPIAEGTVPAAAEVADRRFGGTATKNARCLLVVDDDPIVRDLLVEQFRARGYTVLAASDGASALELLDAAGTVDLVISDLTMPGMDGLALVEEIQRRRKDTPVILLTGYAENAESIAIGGAVSGAFSLLRKPVQERLLFERVSALLREGTRD